MVNIERFTGSGQRIVCAVQVHDVALSSAYQKSRTCTRTPAILTLHDCAKMMLGTSGRAMSERPRRARQHPSWTHDNSQQQFRRVEHGVPCTDAASQGFYFKSNAPSFSSYFVILATYPLGHFLANEKVCRRGWRILGMDLNPGPFSIKEAILVR